MIHIIFYFICLFYLILSLYIKVHFKMRGTNCKICEYSLNIRDIVDFLPEIPSGIRILNFQSWFERKYHFHRGKKRKGKSTTFEKTRFLARKLGSGKKPRLCWVQIWHQFARHGCCCGTVNANVRVIDVLSRKIHLLEITLRFGTNILYITEVRSSIHKDHKAPRGLMLKRVILTFFRADM